MEVPFYPLRSEAGGGGEGAAAAGDEEAVGTGYMCTRSTDEEVLDNRGHRAKYTEALVRESLCPRGPPNPRPEAFPCCCEPCVRAQIRSRTSGSPRSGRAGPRTPAYSQPPSTAATASSPPRSQPSPRRPRTASWTRLFCAIGGRPCVSTWIGARM